MKITYLHQYFKFPDEMGGTRSYDLAKSFVAEGHEVTVLSSTSNKKYKSNKRWTTIEREGLLVDYIYLPYDNEMSYTKRSKVFVQFLYFATKRLLKINCDVLLATSTPLTIGIPALVKRRKHKTPYVFEARDVWPEAVIAIGAIKNRIVQKLLYRLEKTIYKNAAAIVPLSTDMKKSIVTRYPDICKNKPVEVIENISEVNRFARVKNSDILKKAIGLQPRFSVLYAGTFGRVNGIEYVVDMAKRTIVIDSSIVFVLVGGGAMKEEVIEYAKDEKLLNRNIFILDSVSKQELPAWYQAVDMGSSFVIPIKELWANSANKFFDTLAASKPVLINHEGWQAEVIRDDDLGFILPEKLTDESIQEFVNYTQNTELLTTQQKNAFKKAEQCYSLDKASEKYLGIFSQILSLNK